MPKQVQLHRPGGASQRPSGVARKTQTGGIARSAADNSKRRSNGIQREWSQLRFCDLRMQLK
jgi:hypothetical protein